MPGFKHGKALLARKSELLMSGGTADEIRAIWDQLGALTGEMKEDFPLTEAESQDLRRHLQSMVRGIYQEEVSVQEELGSVV